MYLCIFAVLFVFSKCFECILGRIGWGAHWRHLTNATEPSVFGGDGLMSNYFDHLLVLCDCLINFVTLSFVFIAIHFAVRQLMRCLCCCAIFVIMNSERSADTDTVI